MFLVKFGPFKVQSGVSDVTKVVKILKCWNYGTSIGFLVPKNVPMPIFRSSNYFIVIYCAFGQFWAILCTIGSQWRHKGGQDFKMMKFWHYHGLSRSKKRTHANFQFRTIILSCLIVSYMDITNPWMPCFYLVTLLNFKCVPCIEFLRFFKNFNAELLLID